MEEDDGRTVADMSGIERPSLRLSCRKRDLQPPDEEEWKRQLSPEDRRLYIFAALQASLLIALVFIVGLGAMILLLLALWS